MVSLSLLMCLQPMHAANLERQDFRAEGWVSTSTVTPQGQIIQSLDYSFAIVVDGREWSMELKDLDVLRGNRQSHDQSELVHYNGDLYYLLHFPQKAMQASSIQDAMPFAGHVDEGNVPYGATPLQRALWLAYCSGAFLSRITNSLMPTVLDTTPNPAGKWVPFTFEKLSDELGLPAKLEVLNRIPADFSNQGREPESNVVSRDVYVGFRYNVERHTNFAGVCLPKWFKAEYFSPIPIGEMTHLSFITTTIRGELSELSMEDEPVKLPDISGPVRIVDYRSKDEFGRPLYYKDTNGGWLIRGPDGTLMGQTAKEAQAIWKKPSLDRSDPTTRRTIVTTLLLTSLGLLIAAFSWRAISRKLDRDSN